MFARLRLDLDRERDLVTVPETGVSYSLHGSTVFVIEEVEGQLQVEPRVVRTGPSRDGRIAIVEGLDEGAQVVIAGQNKLYRGAPVVVDESVTLQ